MVGRLLLGLMLVVVAQPLPHVPVSDAASSVHAFFSLQSTGDCVAFMALFNTNVTITDPFGSPPAHYDDMKAACQTANQSFVKVDMAAGAVSAVGGGAAAKFSVLSITRRSGDVGPCQLNFTGIDTFTFDNDGLITSVVGYFDPSIPGAQSACVDPMCQKVACSNSSECVYMGPEMSCGPQGTCIQHCSSETSCPQSCSSCIDSICTTP
mmetsp:Transcript_25406/g.58538  ORF Transcript_25406/g.58538 Transcript_25406/m.58538 type:complete len:209 (+) Transcript_25406:40-666(+)